MIMKIISVWIVKIMKMNQNNKNKKKIYSDNKIYFKLKHL